MICRILACSLVVLAATAGFGAAATLSVTADRVAEGSDAATMSCAGTTVTYLYTGADVTTVEISNLPSDCRSGRIWLVLLDDTGAKVSEAPPVSASGPNATLNVTDVPASQVKKYAIAVVK